MNRRSFLQKSASITAGSSAAGMLPPDDSRRQASWRDQQGTPRDPGSAGSVGDLAPYSPRPDKPWNAHRAAHLLRRLGFGPTWEEITTALTVTPQVIVQSALSAPLSATPPGAWVNEPPELNVSNTKRDEYYSWARSMQEWWVDLMLKPENMLREKMVLFWHNHFVSEFPTVLYTQLMYRQNQLFRDYAFGDFRELTKKVTIDPAMLIYLDGGTSRAGNPNENYARELLELFTIGVGTYGNGTPHYTEHDIVELARALTGWTTSGLGSEFRPARFDTGNKTIFGATANYGIEGKTPADVIDLIFNQADPDHNLPRAAIFLCSKLYAYFVYDLPDMSIVEEMARTLVANNWRVEAVLAQLLTSEHFFEENVIGAKIKSPVEYVLGAIRQFKLAAPVNRNNTNIALPETHDPVTAMAYLSQTLLFPPNVKGWLGGRTWISSATVPLRIRYAQMWIEPIGSSLDYKFNPVSWVKALPDATTDATKLLDHIVELLLPVKLTSEQKGPLLEELLGGGPVYEWNPDAPNAVPRIRACVIRIANLGEYQLM